MEAAGTRHTRIHTCTTSTRTTAPSCLRLPERLPAAPSTDRPFARRWSATPCEYHLYVRSRRLVPQRCRLFRVFWDIIYISSAQQGREQKESHDCMDRSSLLSTSGRLSYNRIHYYSSVVAKQPPGLQKLYLQTIKCSHSLWRSLKLR